MNGFRQQPQESKKEKIKSLEIEVQNAQAATRVAQVLVRQLIDTTAKNTDQIRNLVQIVNELQYKVLAFQRLLNIDLKDAASIADELRVKDFNEASDNEDKQKNYDLASTVEQDSIVIITSTTPTAETDAGIFRSKFKLADCGLPSLIDALTGKAVGDIVEVELNGVMHQVVLLGIRKPVEVKEQDASPVLQ
jgi:hypothetical protein